MAKLIYYLTIVFISIIMCTSLNLTYHDIEWWMITIALIVCRICGQEERKNEQR